MYIENKTFYFSEDLFDGRSTAIMFEITIKVELVCNFYLKNYPFDVQNCYFIFVLDQIGSNFVKLYAKDIAYMGKKKLAEYQITNLQNKSIIREGYSGLSLRIFIKNMYSYYITSTYIPTILLVCISYLTFWFEIEDFSNRIMVSLTSLLVLAALFSQISSGLPHTSYLKLIDIWFLGCIVLDFLMILFLVIVNRKTRVVSPLKYNVSTFWNNVDSKMLNDISRICIFLIFILYFTIYVIIVLTL